MEELVKISLLLTRTDIREIKRRARGMKVGPYLRHIIIQPWLNGEDAGDITSPVPFTLADHPLLEDGKPDIEALGSQRERLITEWNGLKKRGETNPFMTGDELDEMRRAAGLETRR